MIFSREHSWCYTSSFASRTRDHRPKCPMTSDRQQPRWRRRRTRLWPTPRWLPPPKAGPRARTRTARGRSPRLPRYRSGRPWTFPTRAARVRCTGTSSPAGITDRTATRYSRGRARRWRAKSSTNRNTFGDPTTIATLRSHKRLPNTRSTDSRTATGQRATAPRSRGPSARLPAGPRRPPKCCRSTSRSNTIPARRHPTSVCTAAAANRITAGIGPEPKCCRHFHRTSYTNHRCPIITSSFVKSKFIATVTASIALSCATPNSESQSGRSMGKQTIPSVKRPMSDKGNQNALISSVFDG